MWSLRRCLQRRIVHRLQCNSFSASLRFRNPGSNIAEDDSTIAKLADGSVMLRTRSSVMLTTVVVDRNNVESSGFLPLSVDYREKIHAFGKIYRGRDHRDKPNTEHEIFTARVVDRVVRPLFPKGYTFNTQIISTLQASDGTHDAAVMAINSASAALMRSSIPWNGPAVAVRVGKINGNLVINPSYEDLQRNSSLNLLYGACEEGTLMIEMGGHECNEEEVIRYIKRAHTECIQLLKQQSLAHKFSQPKDCSGVSSPSDEMINLANEIGFDAAYDAVTNIHLLKAERGKIQSRVTSAVVNGLREHFPDCSSSLITLAAGNVFKEATRKAILVDKVRVDGRQIDEIRPITALVDYLPVVHGSSLFTRGQTQALCTVTLGPSPASMMPKFLGESKKQQYMEPSMCLHYDFPPYSVNEVGPVGRSNRRMIGHGNLAEKAIRPVMPSIQDFPYFIRISSEVTMSNGSSSMATACGGSLALMDAGIPINNAVAGISIGLVTGNKSSLNTNDDKNPMATPYKEWTLLSDILGSEDHYGDMDFKIAGTKKGITAMQLDVKLEGGVPLDILIEAIHRARKDRITVLLEMKKCISQPRPRLKSTAPKSEIVHYDPKRLGDVIGKGGSTISDIESRYNVYIDLNEPGKAKIFSHNPQVAEEVKLLIQELCTDIEVGDLMIGKVLEKKDFGVTVEVQGGRIGNLHMSDLSLISDLTPMETLSLLQIGQKIHVKCLEVDQLRGLIKLSQRAVDEMKKAVYRDFYPNEKDDNISNHEETLEEEDRLHVKMNTVVEPNGVSIVHLKPLKVERSDEKRQQSVTLAEEDIAGKERLVELLKLSKKELQSIAESLVLPIKGTKVQLAEKIFDAQREELK